MSAWGRELKAAGKVRMMADGAAAFANSAGLSQDLTARGFGVRSKRYSLVAVNGVVTLMNVEAPGKFEQSDSATLLKQLA